VKEVFEEYKFGLILEVHGTVLNLSPEFKKYFDRDKVIGGGIGIDILHKKWIYSVGINAVWGLNRTNEPFLVKGKNWKQDVEGGIINIEFSVGYNLLNSKRFKLYPYSSISYNGLKPKKPDDNSDVSELQNDGVAIGFGAIIDYTFLIGKPTHSNFLYENAEMGRSNFGIRLKGMQIIPKMPIKEISNSYTLINLSLFWDMRSLVRKRF
jgi:hypothetical protein